MQEALTIPSGGVIRIADDVVATIARIAAEETPGITGTVSGITEDITKRLTGKGPQRGVLVEVGQIEAIIDLRVEVQFGVKIQVVCANLQQNVKERVESMTGLTVKEVNVKVESVRMEVPKREEEVEVHRVK